MAGEAETGGRKRQAPNDDGTSDVVARVVAEHQRVTAALTDIIASGAPLYTTVPTPTGMAEAPTEEGQRYLDLLDQRKTLTDSLDQFGVNPDGSPKGGGANTLSPNTALSAQVDREVIAENRRQFDIGEKRAAEEFQKKREEEAAKQAETARQNNLASTLDMLEASVRRGELSEREATRRLSAATSAADVQVDTLREFGGKNLPAGTQQFPGLEGNSAFGQAIAALTGRPFGGLQTGGTFGVNPAALAGTITNAGNAGSAVGGVDDAIRKATAALAGMGVPGVSGGSGAVGALTGGV